MKKIYKNGMSLFLLICIAACTPNYYYLKPEISGQIYNQKTKKPLSNRSGYIGYDLGLDEDKMVKTDQQGRSKITPKAESYYIFRPNLKKLSASAPYIYISFDGYESKSFDYSNIKSINEIDSNPGARILEKGDVGIIYLDPEK
ncbi:hypothetical protein V6C59_04790 [Acinetobacter bereziniae]|uniref:hypothetical protein n=1 Tax=Acinetobacter bereziniae TaxID=106648 RepID=UPI002FDAFAF6